MPKGRRGSHGKRVTLKLATWPESDRRAWAAARAQGDVFDESGPAARWSQRWAASVTYGYGRWLAWLGEYEPGTLDLPPAIRVTQERVGAYLDRLHTEMTPQGAAHYLSDLYHAMRVNVPGHDWVWLREIASQVARQGHAEPKRPRMVAASRLLDLGLELMDAAGTLVTTRAIERHQQYRDGLIIALLTCRPIRRGNLAAIRVDHQLRKIGEGWVLVFEPHEVKARQPLEFLVPRVLLTYLDHYLEAVRPMFPRAETHDGLWASSKGCPMTDTAIYAAVSRRTETAFGRSINLHLFRDIAATTVATMAPEHVLSARDLLGHAKLETTERFYNQARSLEASRAHHDVIAELRKIAREEHSARRHRQKPPPTDEETR